MQTLNGWNYIGDHPRMRGEHTHAEGGDGYAPGSSPHARGTHRIVLQDASGGGIIPACAGNTSLNEAV